MFTSIQLTIESLRTYWVHFSSRGRRTSWPSEKAGCIMALDKISGSPGPAASPYTLQKLCCFFVTTQSERNSPASKHQFMPITFCHRKSLNGTKFWNVIIHLKTVYCITVSIILLILPINTSSCVVGSNTGISPAIVVCQLFSTGTWMERFRGVLGSFDFTFCLLLTSCWTKHKQSKLHTW